MDNSPQASPSSSAAASTSILDTLRTVEFRQQLKGYNVDDVDEYLDRAAQEAEALQEHVRQMNERLRQATERISGLEREKRSGAVAAPVAEGEPVAATASAVEPGLSDETLQRTLILAQKFVDQTKRESEAEAHEIVARAEDAARAAVEAAEKAAAKLQAEAQEKLREEVARLESRRTELAADVESMARHLEAERNRLRGALSEILKWVDDNVQPANSLMGVRPKPSASTRPLSADGNGADDDGGPPTLNLQSASTTASSGPPRSF